jgi:hypothetical protein
MILRPIEKPGQTMLSSMKRLLDMAREWMAMAMHEVQPKPVDAAFCLLGGDQHFERLPRAWACNRPRAAAPRAARARKSRGTPHLHLAREINAIHNAAKANVREDHSRLHARQ